MFFNMGIIWNMRQNYRVFQRVAWGHFVALVRDFQNVRYYTVKPVYNDHLYDKTYYLWFIQ